MVQRIGIDDHPGEQLWQSRQRGIVGDIGRGENQGRRLAMQIGQLRLQPFVMHRRARNIARAA